MARPLLVCAALAVLAVPCRADECSARAIVIRLRVQPMAAPKPALRYQLLPNLAEMNPGNPAPGYIKCFMEQQNFFFNKAVVAEREQFQVMPLSNLPVAMLRNYGGSALKQADWAARLDTPDWQVLQKIQVEGMELETREVQELRLLPPALKVRFRAEVAERRFDEAIRTAKTLFALARHLGEHPTEAGNLVGIAAANVALDPLEEMLQQPGCPNLYWALTELPDPLVDLRKGVQGDRLLAATELHLPDGRKPMTDDQLKKAVARIAGILDFQRFQSGKPIRSIRPRLQARAKDKETVHAARRRLIEAGRDVELVERLPALQVILLDEKQEYECRRDEAMKMLTLPCWQMEALIQLDEPGRSRDPLLEELLPHILQARRAQGRLEQRIALLRHVEALRLYAAAHDGNLPAQLTEMVVPLPVDPFTGKAFSYKVEGTTAHIQGFVPPDAPLPATQIRYVVTLQK